MNLNEISEGDSPFGKLDALNPKSYLNVTMVAFVILVGVALAQFGVSQVKSVSGADSFDIPEAGDLA